jgi:hypothetical protein
LQQLCKSFQDKGKLTAAALQQFCKSLQDKGKLTFTYTQTAEAKAEAEAAQVLSNLSKACFDLITTNFVVIRSVINI